MARRCELGVIVGPPETGKSWLMLDNLKLNKKNLVFASSGYDKAWNLENLKKLGFKGSIFAPKDSDIKTAYKVLKDFKEGVLVIVPDNFTGYDLGTLFFQNCARYFVNGGLFVDDSKTWILSKGNINTNCEKILIDARHKMTDVWICLHGLKDILGDIMTKKPTLYIKNTSVAVPKKLLDQLEPEQQTELLKVVKLVKEGATKNKYFCLTYKL